MKRRSTCRSGLLVLVEYRCVRPAAQQRSGGDTSLADHQILQRTALGVESDVVDVSQLVASFAEGLLADELEFPVGAVAFPTIDGRSQGTFINDHNCVRAEAAELRPLDEPGLLASTDDDRSDLTLLGIDQ